MVLREERGEAGLDRMGLVTGGDDDRYTDRRWCQHRPPIGQTREATHAAPCVERAGDVERAEQRSDHAHGQVERRLREHHEGCIREHASGGHRIHGRGGYAVWPSPITR